MEPKYDQTNPQSIEDFGKRLIGKTLKTVQGVKSITEDGLNGVIGAYGRSSFGTLVEKYYYGINPDNISGEPDFPEAGVELKTTPIKEVRGGLYSAKERLVLGLINYVQEAKAGFNDSAFFKKNQRLMLISYLHDRGVGVGDLLIKIAKLIDYDKLPVEDQKIIREDWEKIHVKIREGRAHELSEGDILYLGACTKAVDSSVFTSQPGGIPAKPRAYSFKSGYMTQLVRRELGFAPKEEERAVKNAEIKKELSFEETVIRKFDPFIGKTVEEIKSILDMEPDNKPKSQLAILARRMLGIKGNRIAEFEAAEVTMKTIQVKSNGTPKESMSFPYFSYNEIVNEEWDADEESGEIRASFQGDIEKRFFLVVFKCDGDCKEGDKKRLSKVMFWSVPYEDREEAKYVWSETVRRIKENVTSELPRSSENRVAHVRPHAQNSRDVEVINGIPIKKKCFWLNSSYLKNIVS